MASQKWKTRAPRARELCQQLGETPQIFPVLVGLSRIYSARAELHIARELGEQCVTIAQRTNDPLLLVETHRALGNTLYFLGEFTSVRFHFEQVIALYEPHQDHSLALFYLIDPAVSGLSYIAWALWLLGYPDQALKRSQEALAIAQELAHPFSLAIAQIFAPVLHQFRQERQITQEQAEAGIALATERGFITSPLAWGMVLKGWALTEQGQREEGIAQIHQGMAAWRATGAEVWAYAFSCFVGRGAWKSWTDNRRNERAGGGICVRGKNWRAFLRGRAVSAVRGAIAPSGRNGERANRRKVRGRPIARSPSRPFVSRGVFSRSH